MLNIVNKSSDTQLRNSLITGDVYIDGQWRGLTGSTFTVSVGNHTVRVNDFWESSNNPKYVGGTGYRYGFKNWTDGSVENPRNLTIVDDMAITAVFRKKYCPGDVNRDSKVDSGNGILIGKALSTRRGDPKWDSRCDLNCDGKVDSADQIIYGKFIGQYYPDP